MLSSIFVSALFAVSALSTPINQKRDLVTELVVVTVVDYVTEGVAAAPSTVPAVQTTVNAPEAYHSWGHGHPHSSSSSPVESTLPSSSSVEIVVPTTTSTPVVIETPTSTSIPAPASTVAPTTSAASAPPQPASFNAPTTIVPDLDVSSPTYTAIALAHHNVHRTNHSAPDVTYNGTLARWAQAKAESCVWDESMPAGASGVGMNIAQGTYLGAGNLSMVVSNMWYDGEILNFPAYGQGKLDTSGDAFQGWGHFSQVVWSTTESIGCGSSPCGPGTSIGSGYFVACMYYPPGNFLGQFTDVGKPKGNPTVEVVGHNIVGV